MDTDVDDAGHCCIQSPGDNDGKNGKRPRLDGAGTSSATVDVSRLNGNVSASFDPNHQNKFSCLANLEIQNNCDDSVGYNKNIKNAAKDGTSNLKPTGKSFCPPIFLYNVNVKHLCDQLEAKSPKIIFKIKNVNKHKSKLYLSDASVHAEMMSLLREKKISSYSFTPKEYKQLSLVLRGMYYKTEVEEIKAALDIQVPSTVSKVSKFSTSFSKKNNMETGLFLITLIPGKKLGDISNIKYLLNQSIVWEKPKRKDHDIQCHRCQHWGHISRNCNSDFKCVKCNDSHLPGSCPRNDSTDSDPCCVNCGNSGHPANWRGCPAYKKYLSGKKERIIKAKEVRNTAKTNVNRVINTSLVSPGKTFASLLRTQSSQAETSYKQKSPIVDEFLKLANLFLEPEELTLEQEINKFLTEHKNMSKYEAKKVFLSLLSKVKSIYGP